VDRGSKFCAAALALIVASGIGSRVLWSQSATSSHPATISDQVATEDRLRKPGWWPTKGSFAANSYAGTDVCARCHVDLVAIQSTTSMAKTAARAVDQRCMSCHVNSVSAKPTTDHPGGPCPVARKDCVTCNMQKVQVVDIPVKFTDYQIRVILANDPIPR